MRSSNTPPGRRKAYPSVRPAAACRLPVAARSSPLRLASAAMSATVPVIHKNNKKIIAGESNRKGHLLTSFMQEVAVHSHAYTVVCSHHFTAS
jgi:hypothetical protein